MTSPDAPELAAFLAQHPGTRFFDVFLNDLNTVERGKRIDRDAISGVYFLDGNFVGGKPSFQLIDLSQCIWHVAPASLPPAHRRRGKTATYE